MRVLLFGSSYCISGLRVSRRRYLKVVRGRKAIFICIRDTDEHPIGIGRVVNQELRVFNERDLFICLVIIVVKSYSSGFGLAL